MPATVKTRPAPPFAVEFGQTANDAASDSRGAGLGVRVRVLAGDSRETIFPEPATPLVDTGVNLVASGDVVIGSLSEPVSAPRNLAKQTQEIYRRVLAAARGRHLYRIWNYVPGINALTDGFENYRAFCQGRSHAFEAEAGSGFPQVLPSASAVGTHDGTLSLVFIAGLAQPKHFENPEQVPAYLYPAEHGPRPPSFSRATKVVLPRRTLTFISGTAAIKGHHTVAPGELDAQIDCTLDNLRLISKVTGLGENLGVDQAGKRHFKIYLRRPGDLAATRARLERSLLRPSDHVIYLQADICRAELNVEIEMSVVA